MSDLYLDIEIKRSTPTQDKRWIISGYATTVDLGSEGFIITREAIQQSVDDLLRRSTMLLNHDQNRPIGRVLRAEARDQGLFVEAFISKSEPEIWAKVQEGVLNKFSVRGKVLNSYEEFDDTVNQKVLFITRMELQEVSVVSVPAVPQAEILDWVERKNRSEEVTELTNEKKEVQETEEVKASAETEEVQATAATEEVKEPEKETKEIEASAEEKEPTMADVMKAFESFKTSTEGTLNDLSKRLGDFEEAIAGATVEELAENDTEEISASADDSKDEIQAALDKDEKDIVGDALALLDELQASAIDEQQENFIKLREVLGSLVVGEATKYPKPEAEGPPEQIAASAETAELPTQSVGQDFARAVDESMAALTKKVETIATVVEGLSKKVEKMPIHRGLGPTDEKDPAEIKRDAVDKLLSDETFKKQTPYEMVTQFCETVAGKK